MSKKHTVLNTTPYSIGLPECTIGTQAQAEINIEETAQRYIDTGALVVIEQPQKGKD